MANASRIPCAVVALAGALACAGPGAGAPQRSVPAAQPAPPAPAGPPAPPGVPPIFAPVIGTQLVFVKGGCFQMGNAAEAGGPEEKPAHEVCVDDLYMGKFEVTQDQWKTLMGTNPAHHVRCGEECPVENVSWNDVQAFLAKLNAAARGREAAPGEYRLPTEAEWEYAARSGGKAERYAGRSDDVASVAWYYWNSGETQPAGTRQVGRKAPNGLGLHDMSGNVWEWTGDWYAPDYYATSPRDNPKGPTSGERRVLRGGGFGNEAFDLRTTYRNFVPPDYRDESKGFRLVRTAPRPGR